MKWQRGFLFAIVAMAFVGFNRTPLPWPDEVFYAEPARSLAETGTLAAPMFGSVRHLDTKFAMQPPVAILERAGIFAVFGFSHSANRLAGVLEFLFALFLMMKILRLLSNPEHQDWSRRVRWLILIAFAGDAGVQEAFHSGRPDFVGINLALASLLLLLQASTRTVRSRSHAIFIFAGLASSAAALSHLALAVYAIASFVTVWMLSQEQGVEGRFRWVLCWLGGASIPLIGWLAMIGSDWSVWRAQLLTHIAGAAAGAGSSNALNGLQLVTNPLRHFVEYFKFAPHTVVLVAVSVWANFSSRAKPRGGATDLRPIWAYLCSGLVLMVLTENFGKFLVPFIFLALAAIVMHVDVADRFQEMDTRKRNWAVAIACVVALAPPSARLFAVVDQWQGRSPFPLRQLISENVPQHSTVIGVAQGYFAVQQNRDKFLYSTALQGVRMVASPEDQAEFERTVTKAHPQFALLSGKDDPNNLFGFITGLKFLKLGVARSLPLATRGLGAKVGYDLVLWRLDYSKVASEGARLE
jgi:hypothetical protein